jgi:hypothetical protein
MKAQFAETMPLHRFRAKDCAEDRESSQESN